MSHQSIIAIVGRPNVGKSTLFNRIVKRRIAVVGEEPGITRDRNYAMSDWRGRSFYLIDTGGMVPTAKKGMELAVKTQVEQAIDQADVIVLVVDVRVGITDLDAQIADILKKAGKRVILAVNKVDDERRELEAHQFLKLGLGDPFSISALGGRNIGDFLDLVVDDLPRGEELAIEAIKVAILGRPNVGKSSIVNALVDEDKMIVDVQPGTTRDSIDTVFRRDGRAYLLIDTAGLRRKWRASPGIEYYSALRAMRSLQRCDIALVVLEAPFGVTGQDVRIVSQAVEAGKGVVMAINKWDLMGREPGLTEMAKAEVRRMMPFASFIPLVLTSALLKKNLHKMLNLIRLVDERRKYRLKTSVLNDVLRDWVKRNPVPGQPVKILYATQAGIEPPTFVFFCDRPQSIGKNYVRYLSNRIREYFGFEGTPIRLKFRPKA